MQVSPYPLTTEAPQILPCIYIDIQRYAYAYACHLTWNGSNKLLLIMGLYWVPWQAGGGYVLSLCSRHGIRFVAEALGLRVEVQFCADSVSKH